MVWMPVIKSNYWVMDLFELSVNGVSQDLDGYRGIILDSGTSYTLVSTQIFRAFIGAFPNGTVTSSYTTYFAACTNQTLIQQYPNLTITTAGARLSIGPAEYLINPNIMPVRRIQASYFTTIIIIHRENALSP